jgi:hypothetical protein
LYHKQENVDQPEGSGIDPAHGEKLEEEKQATDKEGKYFSQFP